MQDRSETKPNVVETMYQVATVLTSVYSQAATGDFRAEGRRLWQLCMDTCLDDIEIMHEIFNQRTKEEAFGMFIPEDSDVLAKITIFIARLNRVGEIITMWSHLIRVGRVLRGLEQIWQNILDNYSDFEPVDSEQLKKLHAQSGSRQKALQRLLELYQREEQSCTLLHRDYITEKSAPIAEPQSISFDCATDTAQISVFFSNELAEKIKKSVPDNVVCLESGKRDALPQVVVCYIEGPKWPELVDICFESIGSPLEYRMIVCNDDSISRSELRWASRDYGVDQIVTNNPAAEICAAWKEFTKQLQTIGSPRNDALEILDRLAKNQPHEAGNIVDRLLLQDDSTLAWRVAQNFYMHCRKYNQERSILSAIVQREATALWAINRMSHVAIDMGEISRGIELMAKVHKHNHFNKRRLYALGLFNLEICRFNQARFYFGQGKEIYSEQCFDRLGMVAGIFSGEKTSLSVISRDDDTRRWFFDRVMRKAKQEVQKGNYRDPSGWFRICLVLAKQIGASEISQSVNNIILCKAHLGDLEAARSTLEDFCKKFPEISEDPRLTTLHQSTSQARHTSDIISKVQLI